MPASPLLPAMERAGGVRVDYHGQALVRHFGEPASEYEAATSAAAVFDRSHRTRILVWGRAPGQMLNGVLTGTLPAPPVQTSPEGGGTLWSGRSTYHAVLTPKGKMITDLWVTSLGAEESVGYLLDVPVAGRRGLVALLGKVLPPRFASWRDATADYAMLSVVGPGAPRLLSSLALEGWVPAADLASLDEGDWWAVGAPEDSLVVSRTREVAPLAFSVTGPADAVVSLWEGLVSEGAQPAGLGAWSTLRVEAGRPAFGTDMSEETIPVEAGIDDRAIDHTKGCYTGQEVIVRIRDRGHVNRHLRQLELGDMPAPARGTELLAADGSGKVAGTITSAVRSPSRGGVVALAYVISGADRVVLEGQEIAVPS